MFQLEEVRLHLESRNFLARARHSRVCLAAGSIAAEDDAGVVAFYTLIKILQRVQPQMCQCLERALLTNQISLLLFRVHVHLELREA